MLFVKYFLIKCDFILGMLVLLTLNKNELIRKREPLCKNQFQADTKRNFKNSHKEVHFDSIFLTLNRFSYKNK